MKKNILLLMLCCCFCINVNLKAQSFNDYFINRTLRLDYIFSGTANQQAVSVEALSQLSSWAGRRHHLSELPVDGNGQITINDVKSGTCIYKTSFSTLFQEWLDTDEARNTARGFENTFLVPYPKQPVEISVSFRDKKGNYNTMLKHVVNPGDILIKKLEDTHTTPYTYLQKSGSPEDCIDVAILAEGYTKEEMELFLKDAKIACESLFAHEPFRSMKDRFNIVAVESPSKDSGVSAPKNGIWKNTAFSSHFDSFYSDRYLTSSNLTDIHNSLAGIPYEHIIILANTEQYGGGGIYNSFTLTTAHHEHFRPVVVHEFGHSFAGLADEYYYDKDLFNGIYPFDVEPWEQNITTRVNFPAKWKDMVEKGTAKLVEGGGYSSKNIYRGAEDCRMKTNTCACFCPVCQRAIKRMIDFYTLP
ncbi:M64 family metallopeptidase [uncultured Bacteroides sp.]|uniref:M64 family metallopeptidase n=1 Tax=uncultured Bacteroides sp. TaxID=162156 RepID=UPI003749756C